MFFKLAAGMRMNSDRKVEETMLTDSEKGQERVSLKPQIDQFLSEHDLCDLWWSGTANISVSVDTKLYRGRFCDIKESVAKAIIEIDPRREYEHIANANPIISQIRLSEMRPIELRDEFWNFLNSGDCFGPPVDQLSAKDKKIITGLKKCRLRTYLQRI